jgi:hypothetical protein
MTNRRPFEEYIVTDVANVKEFLARYYRTDRYTGRGEEYAAAVLDTHERHFATYGYDIISRHESVTGLPVAFYGATQ